MEDCFTFAGYMVQEQFYEKLPSRKGYRLATMDTCLRCLAPQFSEPMFCEVGGCVNPTVLMVRPPSVSLLPGYVLSGYAIETQVIRMLESELTLPDGTVQRYERYGYARHLVRGDDGLRLLGYDVMDGDVNMEYLSIMNDLYSIEETRTMAGELNRFGLLDDYGTAKKFAISAKNDANQDPHCEMPVVWQVWGMPD